MTNLVVPGVRVEARFERYSPEKKVPITNIVGQTEEIPSPGALVFTVDGVTYRLDPIVEEGSDELFIIFGDKTNGAETYGGGRYVYAAMPSGDMVTVDFNKSYNPPCVFSDSVRNCMTMLVEASIMRQMRRPGNVTRFCVSDV